MYIVVYISQPECLENGGVLSSLAPPFTDRPQLASSNMSVEEKNAAFIDEKTASVDQAEVGVESKFTAEDERRLVRKLDWRIMPIACIMYLFACECVLNMFQLLSTF